MNRPGSSRARPFSRTGLVSSVGAGAMGMGGAIPPSTSRMGQSRMGTAMRTAGVGVALNTNVDVTNRPVTREGMFGMGMKGAKGQRQVQDKSYYIGLLHSKISQLEEEKTKLNAEAEKLTKFSTENESLQSKKSSVQKVVEELRAEFKDLNLAVELLQKHGSDEPLDKISKMKLKLEQKNKITTDQVNTIFKERNDKETEIRELEEQMNELNEAMENEMEKDPELKERFYDAKENMRIYGEEYEKKKAELTQLEYSFGELSNEVLSGDPEKRRYFEKLQEKNNLEKRKSNLESHMNGGDGIQKTSIKNQVQQDKEEVQLLQKQLQSFKSELEKKKNEIKELIPTLDAFKGERAKKFNELKEKDQILSNFISTFHTDKERNLQVMNDHQQMIVQLLEHIGKNIADKDNLPSLEKLAEMKDDLNFKQEQKDISQTTLQRLEKDLQVRRKELEKVQNLGEKIDVDLKRMTLKQQEMREELHIYNDVEAMRERERRELEELRRRRTELQTLKEFMEKRQSDLSKQNEQMKRKIERDDIYNELRELETKLRIHEQNKFALEEYVRTRGAESDYSDHKRKTLELVENLNQKVISSANDSHTFFL